MDTNLWKQGPMWARPRMPFEDVIDGTRSGGGFNPGGMFGPKQAPQATPSYGITDPGFGTPFSGGDVTSRQPAPQQGGGYTLPSLQRWNKLAPSEQAMQQGVWSDEAGVHVPDVLNLMNKLRPNTATSFAPRWMS